MANTGLSGRVVDENGAGLADLYVEAYNTFSLAGHSQLGVVRTDAAGRFTMTYPTLPFGIGPKPDVVIRAFDPVMRLLHQSAVFADVTDAVFVVPDITIKRADAEGWIVTLGQGAGNRLASDNTIEYLIDDDIAFANMFDLAKDAENSIDILQLTFEFPLVAKFQEDFPKVGTPTDTTNASLLDEVLVSRAKDDKMAVRILLHDSLFPFLIIRASGAIKHFNAQEAANLQVRPLKMSQFAPLHAKVMIVDGARAVVIGSPFLQQYFDDYKHAIDHTRRGVVKRNGAGLLGYAMQVPVHEVSLRIDGPAVVHLTSMFTAYWNEARIQAGEPPLAALPPPAIPANSQKVGVQIAQTIRGSHYFKNMNGEMGILEGYLRAIANATDFIYLENQYFAEPTIANALVLALKRRPTLEVILVLNSEVDIPPYNFWQRNTLRRLFERLTLAERARFGLFMLWTHEASEPPVRRKPRMLRNYVHSKVAIVDDKWATVGTANLDPVSLTRAEQGRLFWPIERLDPESRASELNVLIYDGIAGFPASGAAATLRRQLWSEHLGFRKPVTGEPDGADERLASKPAGGWLKLWDDAAAAKVNGLRSAPDTVVDSRFLPFPRDDDDIPVFQKTITIIGPPAVSVTHRTQDPRGFLHLLGVDVEKVHTPPICGSFDLSTGTWL